MNLGKVHKFTVTFSYRKNLHLNLAAYFLFCGGNSDI